MVVESFFLGHVNGGRFFAVKRGLDIAEVQAFANKHKTDEENKAKLGKVTAYDGDKMVAEAEIVLIHNGDDNAAKTMMVSAQAKVRAFLAGKRPGKRGGRELV